MRDTSTPRNSCKDLGVELGQTVACQPYVDEVHQKDRLTVGKLSSPKHLSVGINNTKLNHDSTVETYAAYHQLREILAKFTALN